MDYIYIEEKRKSYRDAIPPSSMIRSLKSSIFGIPCSFNIFVDAANSFSNRPAMSSNLRIASFRPRPASDRKSVV